MLSTPPLAHEILDVIVLSFQPWREVTDFQKLNVDEKTIPVVFRLLTENPWEKAALAEIYEQHVIRGTRADIDSPWAKIWRLASPKTGKPLPPKEGTEASKAATTIFIESGSTCVYVSELMRRFAAEQRHNLHLFPLGTNNHLTAWLFLNRHLHLNHPFGKKEPSLVPYLFAGRLESKYHGIFPFYSTRITGRAQEEERDGYAQLRLSLAQSDLLLLAASRLSLKYGPLVGSRQNAIFKNACYNACVSPIDGSSQKEIHLFITVQKLVAHDADNQSKAKPARKKSPANPRRLDFAGFHSWKEELNNIFNGICFPAFDLPLDETGSSPPANSGEQSTVLRSPFSTDLIPDNPQPQRLRDGTSAVEMGAGRFRICHTWQELFTKAGLTVKVFVAFEGRPTPANPNFQWIVTEVEAVKKSFKEAGIWIKRQKVGTLTPRGCAREFSLDLIEIGPGPKT